PCLRKHRPRKAYRHAVLDAKLTKRRILSEARVLQKCLRAGISVPKLYFCDVTRGDLYMELLPGITVHDFLSTSYSGGSAIRNKDGDGAIDETDETDERTTMETIGETIAAMHAEDIIHGDLTTSNLLVSSSSSSSPPPGKGGRAGKREVWMIDFGLGSPSGGVEEKAVDLYVLERAFLSTHPGAAHLFDTILQAYGKTGGLGARQVLKRLETVRLRGRKRTMVG
ncbi:MAG: Kae1-associated serine/threonine protein kinase, partial [Oxalobacteraceae bacterium]